MEVNHRVKNNLSVVASLLHLQSSQVKDPRDIELFREAESRVKVMAKTHEMFYLPVNHAGYGSCRRVFYEYSSATHPLLFSRGHHLPSRVRRPDAWPGSVNPCGLIINELVTNTLKYTFPEGRRGVITISLVAEGPGLPLTVSDDGVSLPEWLVIAKAEKSGVDLGDQSYPAIGWNAENRPEEWGDFHDPVQCLMRGDACA